MSGRGESFAFGHGSPYKAQARTSSFASNTSYNGAQGRIEDRHYASIDLDQDSYEDFHESEPAKPAARPALSSRLFSSFSQAQQPAGSALTRSKSILHSRAKSLAAFVPLLSPNTTTTTTPERTQSNRFFGDFFNGESAPVRLGIPPTSPAKEEEEEDTEHVMEYSPRFTERPSVPRRRSAAPVTPPTTNKTSWFGKKMAAVLPSPTATQQDPILSININNSLFPNGPADPLSPHAFNDLLLNATNLLQRMQIAYKEKVDYIASIQPEMDAQKEEVEEADTRSRHLKMQLEDMGRRAQEQEATLQDMARQLEQEKFRTLEAHESARTIRPVRRSMEGSENDDTPRRRKRGSEGSDSGFESDFDRDFVTGGALTPLSPPALALTPSFDAREWQKQQSGTLRPNYSRTSSTASNGQRRVGGEGTAWATVDMLRGENENLRREMGEMKKTLQGCIDFVGGVQF